MGKECRTCLLRSCTLSPSPPKKSTDEMSYEARVTTNLNAIDAHT